MLQIPILKRSAKLKDSGKRPKYIVEHQLKYFLAFFLSLGYWYVLGLYAMNSTQLVSFGIIVLH